MNLAGLPPTTVYGSTFLLIKDAAEATTPSPIHIPGSTLQPVASYTALPIVILRIINVKYRLFTSCELVKR